MNLLPETNFNITVNNTPKILELVLGSYPYLLEYDEVYKTMQFFEDKNNILYFVQEMQANPVLFNYLKITSPNASEIDKIKISYQCRNSIGTDQKIVISTKRYQNPKNVNPINALNIDFEKPLILSNTHFLFFENITQNLGSTVLTIGMKGLHIKVPSLPIHTINDFIKKNLRE